MNTTPELDLAAIQSRLLKCLPHIPDYWKPYTVAHCDEVALEEHMDAVKRYAPRIVFGPVLDWGCMQGIDSLALSQMGFEVHQCDVFPDYWFASARGSIPYKMLSHPSKLPYRDKEMGCVVASGVLEHVPHPSESLKEIWRVLRLGGTLVVTNCPQRYSLIEAVKRRTHPSAAHSRLFTWDELYRLLVDHGFAVETMHCHASRPMLSDHRNPITLFLRRFFPSWIERVPALRAFTQNVMCIAKKVQSV